VGVGVYFGVARSVRAATPVPTLITLATFPGSNQGGTNPQAGLTMDGAGNLYGTTYSGGSGGGGTVFELSGSRHQTLTTLASFNGSGGSEAGGPTAFLTLDSVGDIFGTTSGANQPGTVFELPGPNHQTLSTLLTFLPPQTGTVPYANVILDSSGNLYGATYDGGTSSQGTVFKLSGPNYQNYSTLVNFNGSHGANPEAGLTLEPNGNLLGTTVYTGSAGLGAGTAFELSGSNHQTLTTLAQFSGGSVNAGYPNSPLIIDANGNFFGTSGVREGNDGNPTGSAVFELSGPSHQTVTTLIYGKTSIGTTTLSQFQGVIMDSAGDLFGTATLGGAFGYGGVFELSGPGYQTMTTLISFNGNNGEYPNGELIADSAGNLYGTTQSGSRGGTAFEITFAVPEPASFGLVGLGAATLLARRRRALSLR
jgi:uncharacterized repeat protein (TIGR03803 family)